LVAKHSQSKARFENEVFVWFSSRKKAGICTRKKERSLKIPILELRVKKPKPKNIVKTHLECRYPNDCRCVDFQSGTLFLFSFSLCKCI
jgi:hypothetical protein